MYDFSARPIFSMYIARLAPLLRVCVSLCLPLLLTSCTIGELAAESKSHGAAWINTDGKPIHNFECTETIPFKGDLAPVRIGAKWGYMDKHGRLAIPAQFAHATYFENGQAAVAVGDKGHNLRDFTWGVIDENGKYVITQICNYASISGYCLFHDGSPARR